jgi:multidrug efflux pump subunit AcrA (membrane-fusion protein)
LTSVAPGTEAGKPFDVYRVRSEKDKAIAERVPVTLEAVLDNRVAVRIGANESLKAGDRVVATGIHRLYDGQAVQVVE